MKKLSEKSPLQRFLERIEIELLDRLRDAEFEREISEMKKKVLLRSFSKN